MTRDGGYAVGAQLVVVAEDATKHFKRRQRTGGRVAVGAEQVVERKGVGAAEGRFSNFVWTSKRTKSQTTSSGGFFERFVVLVDLLVGLR